MLQIDPPGPGSWELDSSHFTRPVTRYLLSMYGEQFARGHLEGMAKYGIAVDRVRLRGAGRFLYSSFLAIGEPEAGGSLPPRFVFKLLTWLHPRMRRRLAMADVALQDKRWRDDVREWDEVTRPRLEAEHRELALTAPSDLDDDAFVAHLQACHARARDSVYQHHRLACCTMLPVGDLLAHASDWTGRPPIELLPLLRGASEASVDGVTEVRRVWDALQASAPELLTSDVAPAEIIAAIAGREDEAGDAYREWRDTVCWRILGGFDVCDGTLAEMPEVQLRTLRASAEPSDRADEPVFVDVPAPHRAQFEDLLAEARHVMRIRDERGLYNDSMAMGLMRRALLEAGRRLAEQGRVHDATHAVELEMDEVLALLRGEAGPSADLLAEAAAFRSSWSVDDVPRHLGNPPEPPPPTDWFPPAAGRHHPALFTYVDIMHVENEQPEAEVSGLAASPGVYEGTARVISGPGDFGRIEAGDVLITRATSPSYNVILPLLGAVVTDRGGPLCHAAIVAREYAIPSVVGSRNATTMIPDGARVRVNGGSGRVEVLA